jgi:hypothetical protein
MEESKWSELEEAKFHNWVEIMLIFMVSRFMLIVIAWLTISRHFPLPSDPYLGEKGILWPFTAYDSLHYLAIAHTGYTETYQYAFFPLYSLLIRMIHFCTGLSGAWAGVLLSNLCVLASLIFLARMLPVQIRRFGLLMFALNPIAIFEMSVYTEALFVALCLAVWFLYKRRHFVGAGIVLGLTINIRNLGVLMAIPILVDWWEHRKEQKSLSPLWQGGIPAVLIGSLFPLYLWVTKRNILLFIEAEKYWEKQFMFPTHTLWLDLTRYNHLSSAYLIQIVINFLSLLLVIYLCVRFWSKQKPMVLFLAISTLIPLLYGTTRTFQPATISLFRYIYASFPLYFLIPMEFMEHRARFRLIQGCLIILMVIISMLFVMKLIF